MPVSNEDQFKFLISCIRYSNSGKVDFGEVAKECSIVSKGAAAKRYERMMKAHGIAPNPGSVKAGPSSRAVKTERHDGSGPSKKRKADGFANNHSIAEDDHENFDNVKPDPSNKTEELQVKEEPGQMQMTGNHTFMPLLPHLNMGDPNYANANNIHPNSNDFNGHADSSNFHGLGEQTINQPRYYGFANYEQSESSGSENVAGSMSEPETILISD